MFSQKAKDVSHRPREQHPLVNDIKSGAVSHVEVLGGRFHLDDICAVMEALQQNSSVKDVRISGTDLSDGRVVASMLRKNQNVSSLCLTGNKQLGVDGTKAIAEALMENGHIKELFLDCDTFGGEDGAQAMGQMLKLHKGLTRLYLKGTSKTSTAVLELVSQGLAKNHSLHTLVLDFSPLGSEGSRVIGDALKENVGIVSVDVSRNNMTAEGALFFSAALRTNETLTDLNVIGSNMGPAGTAAVCQALSKNKSVKELKMGGDDFGDEGSIAMMEMLKENVALMKLRLFALKLIGTSVMSYISQGLVLNHTLRDVELCQVVLGHEGTMALCDAVKNNQSMRRLCISEMRFVSNALGDAIKCNTTLRELILMESQFGVSPQSVPSFSQGLAHNTSLTSLSMIGSKLKSEDFKCLFTALEVNHSLTQLNLTGNEAKDDAVPAIAKALKVNRALRHLSLNSCKLSPFGAQDILKVVRTNRFLCSCTGVAVDIDTVCQKNLERHKRLGQRIAVLLAIRKWRQTILSDGPKDVVVIIGKLMWEKRGEF